MKKRDTLLIVSGTAEHRMLLRTVFQENFNLLEAINSSQSSLLMHQNHSCIAAVLLDTTSLKEDGKPVLTQFSKEAQFSKIPVIAFTANDNAVRMTDLVDHGAVDVLSLQYDAYAMRRRVENLVKQHLNVRHLEDLVDEQATVLRHSNQRMVDALSAVIEYRSAESGQHILRIRHFTRILLEEVSRSCPEYGLTPNIIEIISSASALHDVGKISIPDAVLNKPGRLESDEWEIMKTHALIGSQILENLQDIADEDYLRYAHNICHYHHERWDGSGYPEGLVGDDIPICAQVVGLADAYDALTTKRVYKDAVSFGTAANMILRGECGAFSGKLLECFRHVTGTFKELAMAYADGLSPASERFDPELPAPKQLADATALEAVQAKLLSLMHYSGALVAEVDQDLQEYHLLYNPYPELTVLQTATTLKEVEDLFTDQIVIPEDRKRLIEFHEKLVPAFIRQGRRRGTWQFSVRGAVAALPDIPFTVTVIRLDPRSSQNHKILVIWEKVEASAGALKSAEQPSLGRTTETHLVGEYLCAYDAYFTLQRGGSEISKLVGYSSEELKELFDNRLIDLVLPEDKTMLREKIHTQLASGVMAEVEYRVRHKDGSVIWLLNRSRLLQMAGQEVLHSVLTDITGTKQEIETLNKTLARYEIILSQTENVLFEWDLEEDTINFSDTWKKIFGNEPLSENVRENIFDESHIHPDDISKLLQSIEKLEKGASSYELVELRIVARGGRYLWCRLRATATQDEAGTVKKLYGVIINIDEEKRASQRLQDRAERDALTKLLNKETARNRVEASLEQNTSGAMLIIDLDNFKEVNDGFGHMFGDAVLIQIAKEIKRIFRAQDVVARIGGDEFFVYMQGLSERRLVEERCSRLVSMFHHLFKAQMKDTGLSCSVGVAMAPRDGTNYVDLFQCADQALYQAKDKGKNTFVFYDSLHRLSAGARRRAAVAKTVIDSDERPGLANDSLVQYSFERLYTADDVDAAVNELLTLVGEQMKVSRVYVFENNQDNTVCNNTYEWCNEGITPEREKLQNISYETDIPGYENNFDEQGVFYCPDVREMEPSAREIVEAQGIKSMLQCAIRDNGVFRGYVGFDACDDYRYWTREQVEMLVYFSEMLAVFLLKRRAQEQMQQQMDNLYSILDRQDAWIYVIDPETCRIHFLNAKTKVTAPEAKVGKTCYECLMGLSERCPGCPAEHVRETGHCSAVMQNDMLGIRSVAEASLIDWNGKKASLIICRNVSD